MLRQQPDALPSATTGGRQRHWKSLWSTSDFKNMHIHLNKSNKSCNYLKVRWRPNQKILPLKAANFQISKPEFSFVRTLIEAYFILLENPWQGLQSPVDSLGRIGRKRCQKAKENLAVLGYFWVNFTHWFLLLHFKFMQETSIGLKSVE